MYKFHANFQKIQIMAHGRQSRNGEKINYVFRIIDGAVFWKNPTETLEAKCETCLAVLKMKKRRKPNDNITWNGDVSLITGSTDHVMNEHTTTSNTREQQNALYRFCESDAQSDYPIYICSSLDVQLAQAMSTCRLLSAAIILLASQFYGICHVKTAHETFNDIDFLLQSSIECV